MLGGVGKIAQALWTAGQCVVPMHHMGRALHFLAAFDLALFFLAACRSHIVIERKDFCSHGICNRAGTVFVVVPHDPVLIEEIRLRVVQRAFYQLEAVRLNGTFAIAGEKPRIGNGQRMRVQLHALDTTVTALSVAVHQHFAIPEQETALPTG